MNDKQLAALIMAQILPAMQATSGLSAVKLARSFQSRQQGASTTAYAYFFKIGDHRYGSPARTDVFNPLTNLFTHTETQVCETTYQFSAWVPQDPTNVNALTESDILNTVSGIIQSDAILAAFQAQGVGILRVTDVRNPYIVDDHDQFEAVPSFDVTMTHKRTRVSTTPAVVAYEANMRRV
jgi:hypothetical protein